MTQKQIRLNDYHCARLAADRVADAEGSVHAYHETDEGWQCQGSFQKRLLFAEKNITEYYECDVCSMLLAVEEVKALDGGETANENWYRTKQYSLAAEEQMIDRYGGNEVDLEQEDER